MPRKNNAKGNGSIRQITRTTADGKKVVYWQGRYTTGYDMGTGKQVQKSVSGKTKAEVAAKLREITASIDKQTYIPPNRQTVGDWLDTWKDTYLIGVKPFTVASYDGIIKNHLKPAIGGVKLCALTAPMIQQFYNSVPCSPKTVKNIHGVLHRALQQAIRLGYIPANPADACILPRVEKPKIHPLDEEETKAFITAIKGHQFEILFTVALFTGMRLGELLGLSWDSVDFSAGTIIVKQQLQREKKAGGLYQIVTTKNSKSRCITPARYVMEILYNRKQTQIADRLRAGSAWNNPDNLVFTNELGGHLVSWTVERKYKDIVTSIGRPDARFHDLRHSYAVASLSAGDDIKTLQENLGHATASFTLDVYGHVTDQMKRVSAARQQDYIKSVLGI